MTAGKFVIFSLIAVALSALVKLVFITSLNIDSLYIVYLMWLLIAAISIGCCRRLGVLNYLEAIFTLGVWLVLGLIVDLIVVSSIASDDIYKHAYLWISYAVMAVSVFLFHKKRHVEIRRLHKAKEPPKAHH
jgi:hypothetical protein